MWSSIAKTTRRALQNSKQQLQLQKLYNQQQQLANRGACAAFSHHSRSRREDELRPLHFVVEEEASGIKRNFEIVGVRDVEVQDRAYPTRIESDYNKKQRPIRNRYNFPNFISLYVDNLQEVHTFLLHQQIPFSKEGIVEGPDGQQILTVPPPEQGDPLEFFNLCDNPTFVELVQATPEMIQEHQEAKADQIQQEKELQEFIQNDPEAAEEYALWQEKKKAKLAERQAEVKAKADAKKQQQ